MPASPSPSFFRMNYHSLYGPHTAQVPTTIWADIASPGGHGVFETHLDSTIDADDMILGLVALLQPFFPSTVEWDNYVIYTQATPSTLPVPVTSNSITLPGTSSIVGWTKAVQMTMNWRAIGGSLFKIVMLDCSSGNTFDPLFSPGTSGILFDLSAYLVNESNGFMSQSNGRPTTFISATKTLNEKLRKAYRMF